MKMGLKYPRVEPYKNKKYSKKFQMKSKKKERKEVESLKVPQDLQKTKPKA
jgi:hypothetical protein